jgi:hypothetical protein
MASNELIKRNLLIFINFCFLLFCVIECFVIIIKGKDQVTERHEVILCIELEIQRIDHRGEYRILTRIEKKAEETTFG